MAKEKRMAQCSGQGKQWEEEITIETTMEYMVAILQNLEFIISHSSDMGNMEGLQQAISLLNWVQSDIGWHMDGEPGDADGSEYWDAAVERMDHHKLRDEASKLYYQTLTDWETWRENGGQTTLQSSISIR